MKIRSVLLAAVASAALIAPLPALAQAYAGAGFGPSRIDIGCGGTSSCDTSDNGFKLYGGWNIASPWSLEAVYFDWGKANRSSTTGGVASTLATSASGMGVGVAYTYLFGWGRCFARLGVAQNDADTDTTTGGTASSSSHSSTEAYYGFGCGYSFTPSLMLTADADFSRVKYTANDKAGTQLFTLGLRFAF
ncbi:MAG: outer membrane beta-barrel protein [Ideonella sp.]|jgi:OOP family OmpA-OmpF porin|nr:outer membrane beta-barrel protein [Ideonella sp.]